MSEPSVRLTVDPFSQPPHTLVETHALKLALKLLDHLIRPPAQDPQHAFFTKALLHLLEHIFGEFIITARKKTGRLFSQPVKVTRSPALTALLLVMDQPIAFEQRKMAAHADFRYVKRLRQLFGAHRPMGFEQLNDRAA